MPSTNLDKPLRICLISYRTNPHSGGQGVYVKNLSRALTDLGHRVDVLSGPPDPGLDPDIPVYRPHCLDLYNPEALFRTPRLWELKDPVNWMEWIGVSTMGFPEPYTFGFRARRFMRGRWNLYDVVHDNQSLSYGIRAIGRYLPTVATIHHPITMDRKLDVMAVRAPWRKIKRWRWYSFIPMQKRVARDLRKIITVSRCAQRDISRDFGVPADRFHVAPNGIAVDLFHPVPSIPRVPGRLITTNSADVPLKGLYFLLQAVAEVSRTHPVELTVVGTPKRRGSLLRLIGELGIGDLVRFTGRISHLDFVCEYARASIAVVPSMYEGFGLPAGEAMSCGVPVISTTGGALPEVVGEAGLLVPPADADALARAIRDLIDHPEYAVRLGEAGRRRVLAEFTWRRAAEKTVDAYRDTIDDYRRL
jgi:glycosyltransferase involved in cell wall biosynthesis